MEGEHPSKRMPPSFILHLSSTYTFGGKLHLRKRKFLHLHAYKNIFHLEIILILQYCFTVSNSFILLKNIFLVTSAAWNGLIKTKCI